GLQLVIRAEMLRLSYDGDSRAGTEDSSLSRYTDRIAVNALQFATSYWATKHIRLTGEYSFYSFPGTPPAGGAAATNQAAAPGAKTSPPNASADHLHEVSFRLGLA